MLEHFRWLKNSSWLYDGEIKVYIDPWGVPVGAPEADVIFLSHSHYDHFVKEDVERVRTDRTRIAAPSDVAAELGESVEIVSPGDPFQIADMSVDAVPAYNVSEERLDFHPRDNGWVGYVFTIGGTRYYHAGDTDVIPEMEAIDCDVAFLPVGGTYTMTPEEANRAVELIRPQVVVPMHYGFVAGSARDGEDFQRLVGSSKVEVFTPENPFERA